MNLENELNSFLDKPAYGLSREEKSSIYSELLTAATRYHRRKCPAYGRFISALGCPSGSFFTGEEEPVKEEDIPFLPVSIFKEIDLRSVGEEEVFNEGSDKLAAKMFLTGPTTQG